MSTKGWIKLHRKITDNPLWKSETFTRGHAWVDLILLANHEDGYIYVRGNKIPVKRGQVGWSQKRLSERWDWSRTKVRKFLGDLEEEQQIKQHKDAVSTVITIINYEKYQAQKQQKEQQRNIRNPDNSEESEQTPQYGEQQKKHQRNGSHSHHSPKLRGSNGTQKQQEEQQKNSRKTAEKHQRNTNKNVKNVKKDNAHAHDLQQFVSENLDRVQKLDQQLTYEECEKLCDRFSENVVKDVLLNMENYKKLTRNYTSVYLTALNWCKKRQPEGKKKENHNSTSHIQTV